MSVNFSEASCQGRSNKKKFGLCDDPPPAKNPAYIDEDNGEKWIAIIVNEHRFQVIFTAIDHCIELIKKNRKSAKRCDGMLTFNSTVVFVELKQRGTKGPNWVKDAEKQLKSTIDYFEISDEESHYNKKLAYISNSEFPNPKMTQKNRMDDFMDKTGYVLRIQNRIILE